MVTYGFKRNKLFRRFSFYQSRQESLNQNPSGHNPVQGQEQHELMCLNCIIKQVSKAQKYKLIYEIHVKGTLVERNDEFAQNYRFNQKRVLTAWKPKAEYFTAEQGKSMALIQ